MSRKNHETKKERRSRIRTPLDFPTASGRKSRASGDRAARRRNDRENNLRSREGEKEGSAGVRSLFLAFCLPFPNALRPRARRKTGASAACAAFAALFPPKQVLLLIASALICPAAIASRLPLPKSVFPFLPPALLSCRDCFFPFRAGCLRSISAKIRRKTDGFPCRGASFVCAAWGRNALSPPAFSLGPNARTAPHALSRRARL